MYVDLGHGSLVAWGITHTPGCCPLLWKNNPSDKANLVRTTVQQ